MTTIEVLARKRCSSRFTIAVEPDQSIEQEIMKRLRSGNDLLWMDDDDGISILYINGTQYWRPRQRFFLTGE